MAKSKDMKDLCNILTPELVGDMISGISCNYDQGYIEIEEFDELRSKIEKIGELCDIISEDRTLRTYKKRS